MCANRPRWLQSSQQLWTFDLKQQWISTEFQSVEYLSTLEISFWEWNPKAQHNDQLSQNSSMNLPVLSTDSKSHQNHPQSSAGSNLPVSSTDYKSHQNHPWSSAGSNLPVSSTDFKIHQNHPRSSAGSQQWSGHCPRCAVCGGNQRSSSTPVCSNPGAGRGPWVLGTGPSPLWQCSWQPLSSQSGSTRPQPAGWSPWLGSEFPEPETIHKMAMMRECASLHTTHNRDGGGGGEQGEEETEGWEKETRVLNRNGLGGGGGGGKHAKTMHISLHT